MDRKLLRSSKDERPLYLARKDPPIDLKFCRPRKEGKVLLNRKKSPPMWVSLSKPSIDCRLPKPDSENPKLPPILSNASKPAKDGIEFLFSYVTRSPFMPLIPERPVRLVTFSSILKLPGNMPPRSAAAKPAFATALSSLSTASNFTFSARRGERSLSTLFKAARTSSLLSSVKFPPTVVRLFKARKVPPVSIMRFPSTRVRLSSP